MDQLSLVENKVNEIINKKQLNIHSKIIVVTKTFPLEKIIPLLKKGHLHYGENKIQEAELKWSKVKNEYKNLQLHMIGNLQTNKAMRAVKLFDYIHSLDSDKLASKISQYEKELKKKTKLFIQINFGEENQKSGINLNELNDFYSHCVKDLSLNVIGLMCLPPLDTDSSKYFSLLKKEADKLKLTELSMGMSSDFEKAILHGSTYLRIGTTIMGKRYST